MPANAPRQKPKPPANDAKKPTASPRPAPETPPHHPYETLDRAVRASVARMTGGVAPHAYLDAWIDWAHHLQKSPGRQLELMERAQQNALKLFSYAAGTSDVNAPPFQPARYDHRFAHPSWEKHPYNLWKQSFLAVQDWWDVATDHMRGLRPGDADRTRFMARQALDMVSPSNFPWLNPEIIEETLNSGGENLRAGAEHFAHDAMKTLTQIHDVPPDGYTVGTDLACTPGKVVYRNDLFELIQYSPQTDTVQAEPILIVPAWIMKYYILDLSPQNSLINYLVAQGFTVFCISWCNPTADQAHLTLEDYRLSGVMTALDQINTLIPDQPVHAVGYCLGGTMLAIAAATMARDHDDRLASVTLMAAQVDFAEAGELLLFLDESQVAFLEDMMWDQGYLDRPQMARAFSVIRAEDLIYTRDVQRYFLGRDEIPTDMGVWVSDTTRMPARMHSEYLRGLFLDNRLSAGRFAVEGRVIALKDICVPMFVVATEKDHIAPWKSVYKTQLFTDCDLTFVLTSGGHNSGIVFEPTKARGHHRIAHRPKDALYTGPDAWVAGQDTQDGSWWPKWADWLTRNSSGAVPARSSKGHALGSAPGTYIFQQ